MKAIIFVAVTTIASLAAAHPAVNDMAAFKGTYHSAAGGFIEFENKLELVGYDAQKQVYQLRVTTTFQGRNEIQNVEAGADQFISTAMAKDAVANCATYNGKSETLTVPAGTFNTCAIGTDNGGTIWITDVPFGFAKDISIDAEGNKAESELTAFAAGK